MAILGANSYNYMHCLIVNNYYEEILLVMYVHFYICRSGDYCNDANLHYNTTLSTPGGQAKVRYNYYTVSSAVESRMIVVHECGFKAALRLSHYICNTLI